MASAIAGHSRAITSQGRNRGGLVPGAGLMWLRRFHWAILLREMGSCSASSAAVMGAANRQRFSRAAGPGYSWRWPSGWARVAVHASTGPSISQGEPHAGQAMARGGVSPTARARQT